MNDEHRFSGVVPVTLRINGEKRPVVVNSADTLLHTLRRTLGLTGTKMGCENGDCGACTVQVDGVPRKSCMTLTVDVADAEITTIEGFADTPLQRAFAEENGFQCGYCTPGMLLNADALMKRHPAPGPEARREWMESNVCRCTGYEGIERAMTRAAEANPAADEKS